MYGFDNIDPLDDINREVRNIKLFIDLFVFFLALFIIALILFFCFE